MHKKKLQILKIFLLRSKYNYQVVHLAKKIKKFKEWVDSKNNKWEIS